ncbi:MAG: hypothetical protein DMG70_26410 [Acidobacteria bacterium]|nr:MAG: hypothetical protein DMG70_26410 [Acidobacteriota bacterium]PYY05059.1 MAG: hypothetical protein DMG69_28125 [Acidobacteriota bacterium]
MFIFASSSSTYGLRLINFTGPNRPADIGWTLSMSCPQNQPRNADSAAVIRQALSRHEIQSQTRGLPHDDGSRPDEETRRN